MSRRHLFNPPARGLPVSADHFDAGIMSVLFGDEQPAPPRKFPRHIFSRDPETGRCTVEIVEPKPERASWRGRGIVTFDPNPPSDAFRRLVNEVQRGNG